MTTDSNTTIIIERSLTFRNPWWNPIRTKVIIRNEQGVSLCDLEAAAQRQGWDGEHAVVKKERSTDA